MTVVKRKAMCKECPWRKASAPGWLGAATAQDFLEANDRTEGDLPCHMDVDYANPDWQDTLPEATTCVGGHHFNANTHKLPRSAEMREARDTYGPSADVFESFGEFLAHHDNARNRAYVDLHNEGH